MKYHIGLISKLLGLSAEGIRLYERGGIVRSRREGGGGYRFYERPDIVSLMLAMSYRGCGFTLGEAESLVNTDDPSFVAESLRRREEGLEAEIRRKQMILARLRENRERIENAPSKFGVVEFCERPAFYRLEFMRGGELTLEPEYYPLFRKWRALSPFVFPSLRGDWEKFLREGKDENAAGLALMESDAEMLGEEKLARRGVYYPACPCLRLMMRVEGRFPVMPAPYLEPLKEYAEREKLAVTGDPVSHTFLSINRNGGGMRYRLIWLPVEKNA